MIAFIITHDHETTNDLQSQRLSTDSLTAILQHFIRIPLYYTTESTTTTTTPYHPLSRSEQHPIPPQLASKSSEEQKLIFIFFKAGLE